MSDIIFRNWDDEQAVRKQLLTEAKQRNGRRRAVYPPFYQVEVPSGEVSVGVSVKSYDFTIEQAKQLHRHLAEAIAAAEANVADQHAEDDFFVSCILAE